MGFEREARESGRLSISFQSVEGRLLFCPFFCWCSDSLVVVGMST